MVVRSCIKHSKETKQKFCSINSASQLIICYGFCPAKGHQLFVKNGTIYMFCKYVELYSTIVM